MARKLVVEVVADPRNFTKGLVSADRSAKAFTKDMEQMGRGVLSGTVAFKGFARSLAFASGGFLAFAGGTRFLEESVKVARDAAVSQRQLAAQMKASGESFQGSKQAIDQAELSLEKYGFTSEDSAKALTVLERGTGNIAKAIELQGTAADLARAKNLDLASAANILAKVFGGQETALRRAVPGLDKEAHGLDLIREAQQRLAGQAAAATTPQERFAATLHDTQRIIGTALLPVLNRYLTNLSKWLGEMNRSGKLQRDINQTVKAATPLFEALGKAAGLAAQGLGKYEDALVGLQQASKGGGIKGGLADVARFFIDPGFALGNVVDQAKKLFGGAGDKAGGEAGNAFRTGFLNSFSQGLRGDLGPVEEAFSGFVDNFRKAAEDAQKKIAAAHPGISAEQRNSIFDAMIGRLDLRAGLQPLQAQIPALQQIVALIQKQIAGVKDITRQANLRDQLLQYLARIKQARQQIAQDAIDALSLNIDRAGLTKTVTDDIAAWRSVIALLEQQQKTLGFTADREKQIIAAQAQVQSLQAQAADQRKQAADALKQKQQAAEQAVLDTLQFGIERAGATATLKDDIAAERAYQAQVREYIRIHGATLDRERELFESRQRERDLIKQARQKQEQGVLDRLQFGIERASATATLTDDIAAENRYQTQLQKLIRLHGPTLDRIRELFESRQRERDLIKQQQQNQQQGVFDTLSLRLDKAQLTKTLNDDIAVYVAWNAAIAKIERTQGKTIELERQRIQNQATLKGLRQQQIQNEKDAAKQAKEQAAAARQARQFSLIGFGPGGEDIIPSAKALQKRLGRLEDAVQGTILDTPRMQARLNHLRQILSGSLGKVGSDVRSKIKEIMDGITQQLQNKKPKARDMPWWEVDTDFDKFMRQFEAGPADWQRKIDEATRRKQPRPVGGAAGAMAGRGIVRGLPPGTVGGAAGAAAGRGIAPGFMPQLPRDVTGAVKVKPTVVVNQYFQAPTKDKHREARYARMAFGSAFDQ
jgi:hypothetical protein